MHEEPLFTTDIEFKAEDVYIDPAAPSLITEALAKTYNVLPYKIDENKLYVLMEEPNDLQVIGALRFSSGYFVVPVKALGVRLNDLISYHYRLLESEEILVFLNNTAGLKNISSKQSESVIRLIEVLIEQAICQQASDMHIEISAGVIQVRFRISGVLRNIISIPLRYHNIIVNKIKLMAKLNIAENKKPQDGTIHINKQNMKASLRVSTVAAISGEKIAIRVLSKSQFIRTEGELSFSIANLLRKRSIMKNRQGIILVAGPTGSGKTTTLYSLLKEINNTKYNLVTIEDPVEYQMDGITQIHVSPKYGMTFSNVFRSVLRQDPDVILLGEIRDSETAETAFAASMTGHLILASIHTNDTVSAVSRLIDLGVDSHFIASSLKGVIAQRLVNLLCTHCKEPYEPGEEEMKFLRIHEKSTLFKEGSCNLCNYTGYSGRLPVHEILEVDHEIRKLIEESNDSLIMEKACEAGMCTLFEGCRDYILKGLVSINELYRIGI